MNNIAAVLNAIDAYLVAAQEIIDLAEKEGLANGLGENSAGSWSMSLMYDLFSLKNSIDVARLTVERTREQRNA